MPSPSPSAPLAALVGQAGGWLPFDEFMAAALYSPEHGYYSRNIRGIGRHGDFSTAAGQGSVLAHAIAAWLTHHRSSVGKRIRWHVIECGGGDGTMAACVLGRIGWLGRMGLTYHLVEISPTLRQLQQRRLRAGTVCWHDTMAGALTAAGGRALIFSNELVDAFPCVRLRWMGTGWEEMGVVWRDGQPVEVSRPLSAGKNAVLQSSAPATLAPGAANGQQVEVHLSYQHHLRTIADHLRSGRILTIDYGDTMPALYHRRPQGSVRGYFHHLRQDGPELYRRFGHQDLTADVNFTDLMQWGSESGWKNTGLESQRSFIEKWARIPGSPDQLNARLLDPAGAGSAFKVLEQVASPPVG